MNFFTSFIPSCGIIAWEVPLYQTTLRSCTDAKDSCFSDRSPRARHRLGRFRAGKRAADKPEGEVESRGDGEGRWKIRCRDDREGSERRAARDQKERSRHGCRF